MTVVQAFDAVIGALAHDPSKTYGPFNPGCAAQKLEHVLRLRRSGARAQKVIRGAQGTYFLRYRRRDELVQRYAVSGGQFCGRLLH